MTNAELAKKIREAIFNQAEEDGRVMHGDSMDAVIEKALNAHASKTISPGYSHGVFADSPPPADQFMSVQDMINARLSARASRSPVEYSVLVGGRGPTIYEWSDGTKTVAHCSDCAVYNAPALPAGECDCVGWNRPEPVEWR